MALNVKGSILEWKGKEEGREEKEGGREGGGKGEEKVRRTRWEYEEGKECEEGGFSWKNLKRDKASTLAL